MRSPESYAQSIEGVLRKLQEAGKGHLTVSKKSSGVEMRFGSAVVVAKTREAALSRLGHAVINDPKFTREICSMLGVAVVPLERRSDSMRKQEWAHLRLGPPSGGEIEELLAETKRLRERAGTLIREAKTLRAQQEVNVTRSLMYGSGAGTTR